MAPGGQLLDQLNQQQIDKIRQPLFSVDLINAVASSPVQGGAFRVQLQGNNPSQSLHRMKVWYPAGDPVVHLLENADALIAAGCPAPAFQWSRNVLADGTQEIVYDFPDGCFFAAANVGFSFIPFDGTAPVDFPDPFTFIFEFDDGTTSQAQLIRSRALQARRIPTPFSASLELRITARRQIRCPSRWASRCMKSRSVSPTRWRRWPPNSASRFWLTSSEDVVRVIAARRDGCVCKDSKIASEFLTFSRPNIVTSP